jgi:Alpha-L-fucosidase
MGAIINNRLGKTSDGSIIGDFNNYSDRFIPSKRMDSTFESCQTIGMSWGYNKFQTLDNYKTADELFKLFKIITSFNGNLLLNIGPDKDGILDKNEEQ